MAASAPTLWRVDNTRLRVTPHTGQLEAWDSDARFTFVLAGTQGGKTSFGPLWLFREYKRQGPGDYLCVTASFPLLQLKMLPEFMRLWHRTLKLGEWRASEKTYLIRPGTDDETRIIFGSAVNPESLESATAKGAWIDECGQDQFRLESWEAVLRRLSLAQGRVLGTTTPYNLGWVKQQVFDPWRNGDRDYRVVQFPSTMNPVFPLAEYERAKRSLPEWKLKMFYHGLLERPAGMIYDVYNDDFRELGGHRVNDFEIPVSWPRDVGLDFGGVNTAKLYVAYDPDGDVYYVYRADLSGGKTSAEHAAEISERTIDAGHNLRSVWGGAKSEDQQRRDFSVGRISVQIPPINDVEAGIDRVYALIKQHRLFIFNSCVGLRDELGTYRRPTDALGNVLEGIVDKNTFHRLDALRYFACGVESGIAPKIWGLA